MAKPYHHGDLREGLITAAVRRVREHGPESVTVRGLAATLSVSPSAAYHHFPDKTSIHHEVSQCGINLLEGHMSNALAEVDADPGAASRTPGSQSAARFARLGRAYIEFAIAEPNLFAHTFGTNCGVDPREHPMTGAYQLLTASLDDLVATGVLDATTRAGMEVPMWSMVHGFASLAVTGHLEPEFAGLCMQAALRLVGAPEDVIAAEPMPAPSLLLV
jgi:AcrR family transcriptional regulator